MNEANTVVGLDSLCIPTLALIKLARTIQRKKRKIGTKSRPLTFLAIYSAQFRILPRPQHLFLSAFIPYIHCTKLYILLHPHFLHINDYIHTYLPMIYIRIIHYTSYIYIYI